MCTERARKADEGSIEELDDLRDNDGEISADSPESLAPSGTCSRESTSREYLTSLVARIPRSEDDFEWECALAARIQRGDTHAFALLVERYLDQLTRFAMAMADSRDAAEDVVQHVLVWLWESRATIDPARPFKPYLYRAIRNRVLNERDATRVRARHQHLVASEVSSGSRPSAVASPEGAILSAEELEYALRQLSERRETAVRLRYEAQLSYDEIGDAMSISTQAATQLVLRGVEQLRMLLRV